MLKFNLEEKGTINEVQKLIKKRNSYAITIFIIILIQAFLMNLQMFITSVCGPFVNNHYKNESSANTFLLIYYWLYGLFQIAGGIIVDNLGVHWSITISYFAIAIGSYFIAFSKEIGLGYTGRVFEALGCSLEFVSMCKWFVSWWPKKRCSLLIALMFFFAYIGGYCATVPLKKLFEAIGFENVFITIATISLFCFFVALFAIGDCPEALGFIDVNANDKIDQYKKEKNKKNESEIKQNIQIDQLQSKEDITSENEAKVSTISTNNNSEGDAFSKIECFEEQTEIGVINSFATQSISENIPISESISISRVETNLLIEENSDHDAKESEKGKHDNKYIIEFDNNIPKYSAIFKITKTSQTKFSTQVNSVFKNKDIYTHFFLVMFSQFFMVGMFFTLQGSIFKITTSLKIKDATESQADTVQSLMNIFSAIGAITSFLWADFFGKRFSQIITDIIFILCFVIMIIFTTIYNNIYVYSIVCAIIGYFAIMGDSASIAHINDKIDPSVAGFVIGIHNMGMFLGGACITQISLYFLTEQMIQYLYVLFLFFSIIGLILNSFTKEIIPGIICQKRDYKKTLQKIKL